MKSYSVFRAQYEKDVKVELALYDRMELCIQNCFSPSFDLLYCASSSSQPRVSSMIELDDEIESERSFGANERQVRAATRDLRIF